MKYITNWREATVFDIEADNLLEKATKAYIVGFKMKQKRVGVLWADYEEKRIKAFFQWHLDNEVPLVCHNAIGYDIPLVEKLYGLDLSELMVIDTLALSYYLNIDHPKHGLESLAKDFSGVDDKFYVAKEDWESLTKEQAIKRVTGDVEINYAVWESFKNKLIDMASLAKTEIDAGAVGGKRVSDDEELYIDYLVGLSVDEHIDRLLTFLMFKMDIIRLQEKTKWKVDLPYIEEHIGKLGELVEKAAEELEEVMPPVPKYSDRKKPAKPYKINGELSASGAKWEELKQKLEAKEKDKWDNLLVDVRKEGFISELTKYDPPNINGHQQVKDFLTSHGWVPETYKVVRDKAAFQEWINERPQEGSPRSAWTAWKNDRPEDRKVPQVRIEGKEGKELCPSVSKLAEKVPEIRALENYSVIKHRYDTLKGIRGKVDENGFVEASAHGFTNTLRLKHRAPCVNLPGASKPYAEPIRGSFIAPDGKTSLGSDLSGLEDRVKHSFMLAHDPEYVATMLAEDYDPHCQMAVTAGMMTEEEMAKYVSGDLTPEEKERLSAARAKGKTTNYASVYAAGAETIARSAGVDIEEGKKLHAAYWDLNWSVKAIADDQCIITDSRGNDWLINPINGFCYSVRSEKDYFSTLAQGTGAFIFDMWVDNIQEELQERFGKKTMTYQAHDEIVIIINNSDKAKEIMTGVVRNALTKVNKTYKLRREMGCDVQFGRAYSEIH